MASRNSNTSSVGSNPPAVKFTLRLEYNSKGTAAIMNENSTNYATAESVIAAMKLVLIDSTIKFRATTENPDTIAVVAGEMLSAMKLINLLRTAKFLQDVNGRTEGGAALAGFEPGKPKLLEVAGDGGNVPGSLRSKERVDETPKVSLPAERQTTATPKITVERESRNPLTLHTVDRTKTYYYVIKQVDNRDWGRFAREFLQVPDDVIDDIQTDHFRSVQEQQYKMLLRWADNPGNTPEVLLSLFQQFKRDHGSTTSLPPRSPKCFSPSPSPSPNNSLNRSRLKYNIIVQKATATLTEGDTEKLSEIFYSSTNRRFDCGKKLFHYMEDYNLWEDGYTLTEKTEMIATTLKSIERDDIARHVDSMLPNLLKSRSSRCHSTSDLEEVFIRRPAAYTVPQTSKATQFRFPDSVMHQSLTRLSPPPYTPKIRASSENRLTSISPEWKQRLYDDKFRRKPRLDEVFTVKDVSDYEREGRLREAINLIKENLDKDERHAKLRDCARLYKLAVEYADYEEAGRACQRLYNLIQQHVDTTAQELRLFADRLFKATDPVGASLYYVVASEYYSASNYAGGASRGIERCAQGLKRIAETTIRDSRRRQFVARFLLPSAHQMSVKVRARGPGERENARVNEARCLGHLGGIESCLGNWKNRKTLLCDALATLADEFGDKASRFRVYARCLNNLGRTCECMHELRSAREHFRMALEAARDAQDFGSEALQQREIATVEANLRDVERKLSKAKK